MLVLTVENHPKNRPIVEIGTCAFLYLPLSTCRFIPLSFVGTICQILGKRLVRFRYLPA